MTTSVAWAESEKIVSISTLSGYAPYTFLNTNPASAHALTETLKPGTDSTVLAGYAWDLVRESFHAVGYTIKIEVRPWVRAKNNVDNARADILFPTTWSKNRANLYLYSNNSVVGTPISFYVLKNSPIIYRGSKRKPPRP